MIEFFNAFVDFEVYMLVIACLYLLFNLEKGGVKRILNSFLLMSFSGSAVLFLFLVVLKPFYN
ncbi:MAG: hypothetical protein A3I24_02005 [Candidatus Harrisonbacteria bacterium RIFCSPLOWO2_02_FULL_41_13b]|uniref:DUF2788 domain-containing protein n=1 Tax=Candidatus Harrisonbacteria bacterium RIFCSPLOWO2_02_FULL_41_13b TaxID=1798409 RepID=A0A1G1ZVT9_9BACT|nr:MAG: hypothetical protein A3I24_02005 [Candidatus Harrisonbacteria bacterium RIFCSPLOWO2_02_FULL_41_13b]